jgi:hypothetical protein
MDVENEKADNFNIVVKTWTAKEWKRLKESNPPKSNNNNNNSKETSAASAPLIAYHLLKKAEREIIYRDMEQILETHEVNALHPYGGRPWKCNITISDGPVHGNRCSRKGPLFVWNDGDNADNDNGNADGNENDNADGGNGNSGSLELACLATLMDKIPLQILSLPSLSSLRQLDHYNNSNSHNLEDTHSCCSSLSGGHHHKIMLDEEEFAVQTEKLEYAHIVQGVQNSRRPITPLSTQASDASLYSQIIISRIWTCPMNQLHKSRNKALLASDTYEKNDALIDKFLFGIGSRGQKLAFSQKPTKQQALEVGRIRFERDGLWVIGQEEDWQHQRYHEQLTLWQDQQPQLEQDQQQLDDDLEDKKPAAAEDDNAAELMPPVLKEEPEVEVQAEVGDAGTLTFRRASKSKRAKSGGGVGHKKNKNRDTETHANKSVSSPSRQSSSHPKSVLSLVENLTFRRHRIDRKMSEDGETMEQVVVDEEIRVKSKHTAKKKNKKKMVKPIAPCINSASAKRWRLTESQVELCYDACMEHYQQVITTIQARALHHELMSDEGFDVFRQRGRGRFDMQLPQFEEGTCVDVESNIPSPFSFLHSPQGASWMPVVQTLLGDHAILIHKGCFLSLPGSETQVYHQDGVHLDNKHQKPSHAVNVFIPLVHMTRQRGPTEFCIGTHMLGYEGFQREMLDTPCGPAGLPIIFDYRLGHRGLANTSNEPRPILYLTYARHKSFRDKINFSNKRYRKLGELISEPPLSREERRERRLQMAAAKKKEHEEQHQQSQSSNDRKKKNQNDTAAVKGEDGDAATTKSERNGSKTENDSTSHTNTNASLSSSPASAAEDHYAHLSQVLDKVKQQQQQQHSQEGQDSRVAAADAKPTRVSSRPRKVRTFFDV